MHDQLDRAVEALDRAGVTWCLTHGETSIGQGADVDLLVADSKRATEALAAAGFLRRRACGHRWRRRFVGYHDDRWIELDVVDRLWLGPRHGLRLAAAGPLLARRRRVGRVWALAPGDAFWALLVRCIVEKDGFPERHADRLAALAGETDVARGPLAAGLERIVGRTRAELVGLVRDQRWVELRALRPGFLRAARSSPLRTLAGRAVHRAGRLAREVPRRGASVALLGPDGAGKSSIADALHHESPLPARRVYMGLYPSRPTVHGGVPGVGLALRLLRQWGRYLTGRYHQSRGRLVIFDRYSYDALLPPARPLGPRDAMRRRILGRSCPAPDLTVVLDAPGEVLHARSGERDADALETERARYLALRERIPGAVTVDAGAGVAAVRRAVMTLCWRAMLHPQQRS